jgi:hypothetical protein
MRSKPIQLLTLCAFVALIDIVGLALPLPWNVPAAASSGTYYVNIATGSDSNPGTISAPWASVAHATTTPGVTNLFLQGNDNEYGIIFTNAMTVLPYGAGFTNAPTSGYSADVFTVKLSSSTFMGPFTIENISFVGPNSQPLTNVDHTALNITNSSASGMATNITISGIYTANFYRGIIRGTANAILAYSNFYCCNCTGSNNIGSAYGENNVTSISTFLATAVNSTITNDAGYHILSVTNWAGGSTGGAAVYCVFESNAVIANLKSHDVGSQAAFGSSGPVGIQLNECTSCTITNIRSDTVYASHTNSTYTDGQGIGIAYCSNTLAVDLVAWNCQGAGIAWQQSWGSDRFFNCIEWNSGILNQGGLYIQTPNPAGAAIGAGCLFDRCDFFGGNTAQAVIDCTAGGPYFKGLHFANCLIQSFRGEAFYDFPSSSSVTNVTFNGNCYNNSGGANNWIYAGTTYNGTFAAYQSSTSQDAASQHADPSLNWPYPNPYLTPTTWGTWNNCAPQTGSVLIGNAVNITTLYSLADIGYDFNGTPITTSTNIGAFNTSVSAYAFSGYTPDQTTGTNEWFYVDARSTNRSVGGSITNLYETWYTCPLECILWWRNTSLDRFCLR